MSPNNNNNNSTLYEQIIIIIKVNGANNDVANKS